tara:strand:- start:7752 stop:8414 length:663 start_codon:yes stop_codon:yes gene_type:complete
MGLAFANRVKVNITSTGTTNPLVLGTAFTGFQTFAEAGITDGQKVKYVIEDGANFEIGTGQYTASGTTLSRVVEQSKESNSVGTSIITMSADATLSVTATGSNIENAIVKNIVLNQFESLETFTGTDRWYAPKNLNIQKITARLGTVADGTVTVAVRARDVTASSTATTTINISAGQSKTTSNVSIDLDVDDFLTVDITAVGSASAPGSNLNVIFEYTED